MSTLAQTISPQVLDSVIQQVAPGDAQNEELQQFKIYLQKSDPKMLHGLEQDLKSAARVRGRKIMLREKLLSRLGTDWLRKQQEVVEGEMANIEVAKDVIDFNILELELGGKNWQIGKMMNVPRLDEMAATDPMIQMIKHRESEDENEIMKFDGGLDEEALENMFGGR